MPHPAIMDVHAHALPMNGGLPAAGPPLYGRRDDRFLQSPSTTDLKTRLAKLVARRFGVSTRMTQQTLRCVRLKESG